VGVDQDLTTLSELLLDVQTGDTTA